MTDPQAGPLSPMPSGRPGRGGTKLENRDQVSPSGRHGHNLKHTKADPDLYFASHTREGERAALGSRTRLRGLGGLPQSHSVLTRRCSHAHLCGQRPPLPPPARQWAQAAAVSWPGWCLSPPGNTVLDETPGPDTYLVSDHQGKSLAQWPWRGAATGSPAGQASLTFSSLTYGNNQP